MAKMTVGLEAKTKTGWKYYLSFKDEHGKWRKKKKTFKTRLKSEAAREAEKWRDEEEKKAATSRKGEMTVSQALTEHVEKQHLYGEITQKTYEGELLRIRLYVQPHIGDMPFYGLTSDVIEEWETALLNEGLKIPTVGRVDALMRKVCNAHFRKGLMERNVFLGVKAPRGRTQKEIDYLDKDGIARLMALVKGGHVIGARNDNLYLPIMLGLFAGLRVGEVCGLTWRDINFATGEILVHQAAKDVNRGGKKEIELGDTKTHKARIVIMAQPLREALAAEADRRNPNLNDFVSIVHSPNCIGTCFSRWAMRNSVLCQSGKRCYMHALRHTFATQAIAAGMDVKSLASLLGHDNAMTTLRYYASDDAHAKRVAMERFSDYISMSEESDF